MTYWVQFIKRNLAIKKRNDTLLTVPPPPPPHHRRRRRHHHHRNQRPPTTNHCPRCTVTVLPLPTPPLPATITTTRQGITVCHEQRSISFIYILTSSSLLKLHYPQPSAEEKIHPNQLCKEVTPCQASVNWLKWSEKKVD